jgi:NitT/TauT family transport system substrate-binding protein/putative hydroxymethylpyrimidine transport system substrate-binding protein
MRDNDPQMPARRACVAALCGVALLLAAGCGSDGGSSSTRSGRKTVQLALDFTPNAVHAPIYAAVRTGADARHRVRLVIRQPGSGPDALKLVAAGKLDMGILDIADLAIARQQHIDVVGVGALVTRPLAALITRDDIARPRDLEGKSVGVSGLPSDPAFLNAIVSHDGGDFSKVRQITIGFNSVTAILARKVQGVPVFWNAEGVALRELGVRTHEFRVEDYGAPAYPEVILVTARKTLQREPEVIKDTLLAIRDGERAVQADPDAATRQIAKAASTDDLRLIGAQIAAVRPIFSPTLQLDRPVLQRWAAFVARLGIVRARPDVDSTFAFGVLGAGS